MVGTSATVRGRARHAAIALRNFGNVRMTLGRRFDVWNFVIIALQRKHTRCVLSVYRVVNG